MIELVLSQTGGLELPYDVQVEKTMARFDMIVAGGGMILILVGLVIGAVRREFVNNKQSPATPSTATQKRAKIGTTILVLGCAMAGMSALNHGGPSANERWKTHIEIASKHIQHFEIDAAAKELSAAMAVLDEVGAEDLRRAATVVQLAAIDQNNGAFADAAAKFERALRIMQGTTAATPKRRLEIATALAASYFGAQNVARAEEVVNREIAFAESSNMSESTPFALLLNIQGMVKLHRFEFDEAEKILKQSLAIAEADPAGTMVAIGRCRAGLGLFLQMIGDAESAVDVYRKSITELESMLPPEHVDVQATLTGLRDSLLELGRTDEASEIEKRITLSPGFPANSVP